MKTSQIISVYNSELFNKPLSFPFELPAIGDVLHFTNKVEAGVLPENGEYTELFIFEKNKSGVYTKLSMSKIIESRGTVGESLRRAIENRDLKKGKDLVEVLNGEFSIKVTDFKIEDRYTDDGRRYGLTIYTLDWC